jgi:hypothetical protein
MTDDERIAGLIRRTGASVDGSPDFDEIYRRSRRRRIARFATSLAVTLVLAVVAGVSINAIPTSRTIRFAQTATQAAPSTEPGQIGAANPSQTPSPGDPTDAHRSTGCPTARWLPCPTAS